MISTSAQKFPGLFSLLQFGGETFGTPSAVQNFSSLERITETGNATTTDRDTFAWSLTSTEPTYDDTKMQTQDIKNTVTSAAIHSTTISQQPDDGYFNLAKKNAQLSVRTLSTKDNLESVTVNTDENTAQIQTGNCLRIPAYLSATQPLLNNFGIYISTPNAKKIQMNINYGTDYQPPLENPNGRPGVLQ